ncbi:MAG: Cof-type HAD-IIB family hydrolase [Clostridia bacterium]|nr:Cof-type HAD-IIB family hydrolase [Clostridia bacterium]
MRTEAIIFDLDDTLLRDDLTISADTIKTLREASRRDIHIIPASGRARESMLPFVEQIGCAALYIACNGAEVWSPAHELMRRVSFPLEVAEEIVCFADEHACYAQTYSGAHFYYNRADHWAESYARASMLTGMHTPELIPFIQTHPTSKILMMHEPVVIAEMLREARRRFAGRASATCSKPYFLEFNPPEATKGLALSWCAERLGFDPERAIAFGDSLNDLSMLLTAGTGVCVANAREDVRMQVRRVCGSNQEDGVARYIQEHVLND